MRHAIIALLVSLSGCQSTAEDPTDSNRIADPGGENPIDPEDPTDGHVQVGIGKVSVYQAVEAILWSNGAAPVIQQAPVIEGRDGIVRVFVRPDEGFAGGTVSGTLTLSRDVGEDVVIDASIPLEAASTDVDLASTLIFDLDGELLEPSTEFSVALHGTTGELEDTFDSAADLDNGLVMGASDHLTVVIVPIEYNADGSGRLPDLSPEHLELIHDTVLRVYPARSVEIRVGDPLPWSQNIGALNVFAWANLLGAISNMRGAADEPPNTYYYGMFNSEDTFKEYCADGCVAGLSSPGFNTTNVSLRSSVGIGFVEVAAETLVHEVGHAHGRFHAPCGGAAGADPGYPHPDAEIGTWGYDILTGELKDPQEYTDVMGYCFPQWVSNYTYYSLWERIAALGAQTPQARSTLTEVTRLYHIGPGDTRRHGSVLVGDPRGGGIEVILDVFDEAGVPSGQVPGWLAPFSHFEGGTVTLETILPEGWTATMR